MKNQFMLSLLVWAVISVNCLAQVPDDIFADSYFSELDYGLYWFGEDNQFEKAGDATVYGSDYYNPSKPTYIYIHGWQSDQVAERYRETFYDDDFGIPDVDFAEMWRDHGYNVGIFYWNQFADEQEVKDAEAKIWSTDGDQYMRWLDTDGVYHYGDVDKPIAELFLENYSEVMSGYTGDDIRIGGHSLGSQVAIRLVSLIQESAAAGEIEENLVPDRLTLLDAFFSNWSKDYLNGQWTGEASRELVADMIDEYDTAIDSYRTSLVTSSIFFGDENADLHNQIAFCEQDTSYFDWTGQVEKHMSAAWLYLWSIDYQAPIVEDSNSLGVSAAADNDLVREWMSSRYHIDQRDGGNTENPEDDLYRLTRRL